jgi:type II secretory pathway component PulF
MQFHYSAFQSDGRIVEGNTEAKTQNEVLEFLVKRGLRPVAIRALVGTQGSKRGLFSGQKNISVTDKIFITKYLGLMLKVGTDLFRAIDILIADFDKPVVKQFMLEVKSDLEKGQPFHATFARYPKFFSPVFVNLLKAGESSGNLDHVLEDLNASLEKESDLRSKLRAALVYPVILVILAALILTFLLTFALPKIAEVFSGGGFNPPTFSRIVFAVGLYLNDHIALIWGLGIVLIISAWIFFAKTMSGKRALIKIVGVTPLVRTVVTKLALQRFAATFSSLLKSGLPIIDALEITADAVGNINVAESLRRVSREGMAKGITIGEAFKKESSFPAVVTNLIAVSEKAGHLDEILKTLSEFYEKEIDSAVKTLISFLEPALLLVIGGIVGVIALSIIVPIYQLVGQF